MIEPARPLDRATARRASRIIGKAYGGMTGLSSLATGLYVAAPAIDMLVTGVADTNGCVDQRVT